MEAMRCVRHHRALQRMGARGASLRLGAPRDGHGAGSLYLHCRFLRCSTKANGMTATALVWRRPRECIRRTASSASDAQVPVQTEAIDESAEERELSLDEQQSAVMMLDLSREKKRAKLKQVFHNLLQNGTAHTAHFNIYLRGLSLEGAYELVNDRMRAEDVPPNVETMSILAHKAAVNFSRDMMDTVISLTRQLKIQPDTFFYEQLLHLCAREGNVDEAYNILEQMREAELVPQEFTHGRVIETLARAGQMDEATSYFELLDGAGHAQSVVIMAFYLGAAAMHRRWDAVDRELSKYRNRAGSGYISVLPFNVVLNELAKAEEGERMLELYGTMRNQRPHPNGNTYATIIKYFSRKGNVEEVDKLFVELKLRKVRIGVNLHNVMIMHWSNHGVNERVEFAYQSLRQGARLGLNRDTVMILLRHYARISEYDRVEDVWNEFLVNERVRINICYYRLLFYVYGKRGGKYAEHLYEQLRHERGCFVDRSLVELVTDIAERYQTPELSSQLKEHWRTLLRLTAEGEAAVYGTHNFVYRLDLRAEQRAVREEDAIASPDVDLTSLILEEERREFDRSVPRITSLPPVQLPPRVVAENGAVELDAESPAVD